MYLDDVERAPRRRSSSCAAAGVRGADGRVAAVGVLLLVVVLVLQRLGRVLVLVVLQEGGERATVFCCVRGC